MLSTFEALWRYNGGHSSLHFFLFMVCIWETVNGVSPLSHSSVKNWITLFFSVLSSRWLGFQRATPGLTSWCICQCLKHGGRSACTGRLNVLGEVTGDMDVAARHETPWDTLDVFVFKLKLFLYGIAELTLYSNIMEISLRSSLMASAPLERNLSPE